MIYQSVSPVNVFAYCLLVLCCATKKVMPNIVIMTGLVSSEAIVGALPFCHHIWQLEIHRIAFEMDVDSWEKHQTI